jgi:hypothetical protein
MNFPTIFDLLDRLAFLRGGPAVAIVLSAAALAVVVWDIGLVRRGDSAAPRRIAFAPLAFPALLVAYLVGGLLLVDVFDPRLAVVTVMSGIFVALIVFVTGMQTRWGRPPAGLSDAEAGRLGRGPTRTAGPLAFTERALLRLALVVAVLLGALWLARAPGTLLSFVPAEQAYLEAAIFGLAGLGLVGLAASAEPLPAGVGLLLFLAGFTLFYGLVDPSLVMVVALIILQLTVALVVAYLAQARYLPADAVE